MRRPEAAMARRRIARIVIVTLCAIVMVPLAIIAIIAGARGERR